MHHPVSIAVLGATGNLGRHVCLESLTRSWKLSVAVRNRSKLDPAIAAAAQISEIDLTQANVEELGQWIANHDVFVFCAGNVSEGEGFVRLFDKAVSAVESLDEAQRPVCWWMAGAALLPLDELGRVCIDLPKVSGIYWPHRKNHERLLRSPIDWRLLCPGPMVEQPPLGLNQLRISKDALPVALSPITRLLPSALVLPFFAAAIPKMIISYADAARVMLDHSERHDSFSKCRVGIALPDGMKGRKKNWTTQSKSA